ncbi:MAG: YcxB family protein [Pseudomonadota bacterium]
MRRLTEDGEATHEIVVTVPNVLLQPGEAVFDRPGPTINLAAPKWVLIGVPFVAGAVIQLLRMPMRPIWIGAAMLVVVIAVAGGLWRLWAFWQTRGIRDFARSRFGGQALDWRLDETEVRQTGPFLDTAVPWSAFVHVLDQPKAFVFVLWGSNVMILPRRLLSEAQQADVRDLIDRARDRGLIGDMPAHLMPPWDLIRDGVRERYAGDE